MNKYCALLWTTAFSTILASDGRSQRTSSPTPAAELVRQFAEGENDRALEISGDPCPADDQYGNEVFRGLLALGPTGSRVQALAGAWRYALRTCDDERIADWFRLHIRQTKDTYAFLSLGIALAQSPTPANLDALRDGVFRDDLSERARGEVLAAAETINAEEQIRWLMEGYRSGRSIPVPYLNNRFLFGLSDQSAIGRTRALIVAAVRARPDMPSAENVIRMLAGDALGPRGDRAWREQLGRALTQLAADPRATAEARAAAEGAAAEIGRSNRQ
jgi:hypothetical protein